MGETEFEDKRLKVWFKVELKGAITIPITSKKIQISSNSSLGLFFFDIREVREMHSLSRAASMSTEIRDRNVQV